MNRSGGGRDAGEFMEKLAKVPLRYLPGERWMYSSPPTSAADLVEAISGQRFDQYLQKNDLRSAEHEGHRLLRSRERKLDRFAANYERQPDKTLKLIDDPERSDYLKQPTFFSGGGGLTGTTEDYLRFCEMLRRGGELDGARILGSAHDRADAPQPSGGRQGPRLDGDWRFSETAYEGVGFGLGFAMTLGEVEAGTLGAGDYYWGGAASTIFWVDPEEDLVVDFHDPVDAVRRPSTSAAS